MSEGSSVENTEIVNEVQQNKTPQTIPVDVGFLQAILEYMKSRPYQEVFQFIDVLTGRAQVGQQPQGQPQSDSNITEVPPRQ